MHWLFAILVLAALVSGLMATPVPHKAKEPEAPCTTTEPPKPVPPKDGPRTVTITVTVTAPGSDCESTPPPSTTTTEDDAPPATPTTTPRQPPPSKTPITTPGSSPTKDNDEPQPTGSQGQYDQEVLELVNQHRQSNGVAPLKLDNRLNAIAKSHSDYQKKAKTMTHSSPAGSLGERFKLEGIENVAIAENVAWNQRSAKDVFTSWKNSPGHDRNMLNPAYKRMGLAVSSWYWTQTFAGV
ncbi:hypothetical protein H4R35_005180 [Dimargaris xerosporica]|nr:hypothetical protein H4R35_005180 [Dimargaris xerosporica]